MMSHHEAKTSHCTKNEGYQFPPFQSNRNKNGRGKVLFIRESKIPERMSDYEPKTLEVICFEAIISKRAWFVFC